MAKATLTLVILNDNLLNCPITRVIWHPTLLPMDR